MSAMTWDDIKAVAPVMCATGPMTCARIECGIFGFAQDHAKASYRGGQWKARKVGEFTLLVPPAPRDDDGLYSVLRESNYCDERMDAVTYGAAVTLQIAYEDMMAACKRANARNDSAAYDAAIDRYDAMRQAFFQAPEVDAGKVYRFLD